MRHYLRKYYRWTVAGKTLDLPLELCFALCSVKINEQLKRIRLWRP